MVVVIPSSKPTVVIDDVCDSPLASKEWVAIVITKYHRIAIEFLD